MPKSFLQYLKEEQQQGDPLFGWWFRAKNTWGGNSSNNNTLTGMLGGVQTWGGAAYTNLPNLPQPMLDLYDWNGDGIVGDNDQELIFQISEIAFQIYEQTGEFPPAMTAAEYLENWEYYSELYGVDFPDPNGFIETPGSANAPRADEPNDFLSGTSIAGLRGILEFMSDQFTVFGAEFFQEYHPEFYEQIIALYDYDGDGTIDFGTNQDNEITGAEAAAFFLIYYYYLSRGFNPVDTENTVTAENYNDFLYNATRLTDTPLQDLIPGYVTPGLPFRPTPPDQPPEAPAGDFGGSAPVRP